MKKIRLNLESLIAVLEAMRDSGGTEEVLVFELNGYPAIIDENDPENIITFAPVDDQGEIIPVDGPGSDEIH